jgi:hypothetical protein
VESCSRDSTAKFVSGMILGRYQEVNKLENNRDISYYCQSTKHPHGHLHFYALHLLPVMIRYR